MSRTRGDGSPAALDPAWVEVESWAWWAERRWRYNVGLAVAGILAFLCHAFVCLVLLPRVTDLSESDVEFFAIPFYAFGYFLAMLAANVGYGLGPLAERVLKPADPLPFRRVCYRLGFCFSVALPFALPATQTILVFFFPSHWGGNRFRH